MERYQSTSADLNVSRDLFEDDDEVMVSPFMQLNSKDSEVTCGVQDETYDGAKDSELTFGVSNETYDGANQNIQKKESHKQGNKAQSKQCPLCHKTVNVLSKHLKVHKLDNEDRLVILYSTRKRSIKSKNLRQCPFPDCKNLHGHRRLDHHLIKYHKLAKTDCMYRQSIRQYHARPKQENIVNSKKRSHEFADEEGMKFRIHLEQLSGGHLSLFNAKQQEYKIKQILIGANLSSTENFAGEESKNKLERYITEYSKTHECSSAITMCSTLIGYLNYLISHCKGDFIAISTFKTMINKWKKAFRKGRTAKDNLHTEITQEDARAFLSSALYTSVTEQLQSINNSNTSFELTRESHCSIRDTIILSAFFRNGCRSCAIANMTVAEFKVASFVENEQSFVVKVADHKTAGLHGCATIVLSFDIHSNFSKYMTKIRPMLMITDREEQRGKLFVTWSGKEITSDDLGKGIQRAWNSAGLKSKISSTMLRKTTTTRVHREMPELKEGVARHMAHNLTTAEAYYKIVSKTQDCVKSSNVVYKALTGINVSDVSEDVTEDVTTSDVLEDTMDVSSMTDNYEDTVDKFNNRSSTRGRSFYSDTERSLIAKVFRKFIEGGKIPTMVEIRKIMETDERLENMIENKRCQPLKLKGAVHGLINRYKKSNDD